MRLYFFHLEFGFRFGFLFKFLFFFLMLFFGLSKRFKSSCPTILWKVSSSFFSKLVPSNNKFFGFFAFFVHLLNFFHHFNRNCNWFEGAFP